MQLSTASAPSGDQTTPESVDAIGVILAYENLSAALWAAEKLAQLFTRMHLGTQLHLSPWSFAMLADSEARTQALGEAADAQLLVVATSSEAKRLPNAIEVWLGDCLRQNGGISAVAAFLGLEGGPEGVDSLRFQTVRRVAEEAGCEFFAPADDTTAAISAA